MRLSVAYSLLVQQKLLWNKKRFDVLATAMELLAEDDDDSVSVCENQSVSVYDESESVSVIDLTANDESVAEFVDLTKDPEVFDLCSSSSSSCSSSRSSSSSSSAIMPRGLLKRGVDGSTDSDISSAGTNGHQGLSHPQLIGTLIRFKKSKLPEQRPRQQKEEERSIMPSISFFLCADTTRLRKRPLHPEHPDCSMGLKLLEKNPTVTPETDIALCKMKKNKNLSDAERTAIKDHLLVRCVDSPTGPFTLPAGSYDATAKQYKVSTRTVKRIWYQYRETAAKNNGVGDVGTKRKGNCGRKRKETVLDSLEEMKKVPKKHKKSQRRLSLATGVSQSTICRRHKSAELKKSRVHMLPHLTNNQRIARVQFALSQLHDPFDNSLDRHFKSLLIHFRKAESDCEKQFVG